MSFLQEVRDLSADMGRLHAVAHAARTFRCDDRCATAQKWIENNVRGAMCNP